MKLSLPALLLLLAFASAHAQPNPGCDGTRYKADVFTSVSKTTVPYATTVNILGVTMTLSMDVYQPVGDTLSQRPAIVLAHGGSFILGDKSQMKPYAELLAKKGYVAVSIQYRLFPFLTLGSPDSLEVMDAAVKAMGDMKAAVRFLRLDAATDNDFRIDPNHIFIGGYSAGAVTALHAAYVDEDDVLPAFIENILENNGGLTGASGNAVNQTYSSDAEAVLSLSGGLYRAAWVDENDAPLTSIHGTADQTVFYQTGLAAGIAYLQGSALIHARADAAGVDNTLITVQGGGHTDIYSAAQYAAQFATFWVEATTMLEALTCALDVDTEEPPAVDVPWSLAPNPASDAVRLEWPAGYGARPLRLLDAQGRTVRTWPALQPGETVPLGDVPPGLYAVQLAGFKIKWLVKG
jgi:para-nitrobenzyl esterase